MLNEPYPKLRFKKGKPTPLMRGGLLLCFLCCGFLKVLTAKADSFPAVKLVDAFPKIIFKKPVDFLSANDGSDTVYCVEQEGVIRSFANNKEAVETAPFLDVRDRVQSSASEQGLLGLVFDPNFKINGRFYVNYTQKPDGATVISRFETKGKFGLPSTEKKLLTIKQPFANHNGGGLAFGKDGFLYIGLGDGGSAGDPFSNAQNKKSLLGKILRIDVSGDGYTIPPSNPFYNESDEVKKEIFAYGLRNPWRISFDSKTGELWAGDVGQNKYEEIDLIVSGGNYGWKILEGNSCFNTLVCNRSGLIEPIYVYGRTEGQSVTGGFVYRGAEIPKIYGSYVFGDFATGKVWTVRRKESAKLLLESKKLISSFGIDDNNELYLLSYGEGKIFKFVKQ